MGKRIAVTCAALVLTAALVWLFPGKQEQPGNAGSARPVLLIWVTERESAAMGWLKKQAAAYEKKTGVRTLMRRAEGEEAADALAAKPGAVIPDLLVGPEGDEAVALRGYALFLRDDGTVPVTPAPTSALFFRPSPQPLETPAPPAFPSWDTVGAVLTPRELSGAVPGAVASADPPADFQAGRARAALLTAGQAARLTVGARAYPVPDGGGLIPVRARAFSPRGQAFEAFLKEKDAQRALAAHGLYALAEPLYPPDDPVRFLIDASRGQKEK